MLSIQMKRNSNFQITKSKDAGLKPFKNSKLFIEYSMDDIYKNIEKKNKEHKILIVFDDMIRYMLRNKTLTPIVTELFIEGRKINISFVFITYLYFAAPKILDKILHTILS